MPTSFTHWPVCSLHHHGKAILVISLTKPSTNFLAVQWTTRRPGLFKINCLLDDNCHRLFNWPHVSNLCHLRLQQRYRSTYSLYQLLGRTGHKQFVFLVLFEIYESMVSNNAGDVRHVLQSSQVMPCSTRLAMKPVTYDSDKSFMLQLSTFSCCTCSTTWIETASSVPVPWFADGCGTEASNFSKNECKLSRSSVLSSSWLVFLRSLNARPLMILIFRASKNCPTFGLLSEPQCKRITPNVFSRRSWLRFWVSRYLKPASFNILHTC